jgi:hypothetical protein
MGPLDRRRWASDQHAPSCSDWVSGLPHAGTEWGKQHRCQQAGDPGYRPGCNNTYQQALHVTEPGVPRPVDDGARGGCCASANSSSHTAAPLSDAAVVLSWSAGGVASWRNAFSYLPTKEARVHKFMHARRPCSPQGQHLAHVLGASHVLHKQLQVRDARNVRRQLHDAPSAGTGGWSHTRARLQCHTVSTCAGPSGGCSP